MKLLHSRYFRLTCSEKLVLFLAPIHHSEFQVPKNDQKGSFLGKLHAGKDRQTKIFSRTSKVDNLGKLV